MWSSSAAWVTNPAPVCPTIARPGVEEYGRRGAGPAQSRGDLQMRIRVTMYYKPFPGMTKRQKKREGGATDMMGNPLYSLEEYLMGDAEYVSVARDHLAGPPGKDPRFRTYGTRVRIPEIDGLMGWDYIDF